MNISQRSIQSITPLLAALRDFEQKTVQAAFTKLMASGAVVHMCHPFGDIEGTTFYDTCFAPLLKAIPDVERRDTIIVSGQTPEGKNWIG
ncbi:MAG: polyketide cyclase, partial [Tateyamaria sp.]|nr:polyketide cyclase [Tateyamaria sp.]